MGYSPGGAARAPRAGRGAREVLRGGAGGGRWWRLGAECLRGACGGGRALWPLPAPCCGSATGKLGRASGNGVLDGVDKYNMCR